MHMHSLNEVLKSFYTLLYHMSRGGNCRSRQSRRVKFELLSSSAPMLDENVNEDDSLEKPTSLSAVDKPEDDDEQSSEEEDGGLDWTKL